MKIHITFLLTQNAVFLGVYLFLTIQSYSYFPPYLYLNLIQILICIIVFYAQWISQDNESEKNVVSGPPLRLSILIVSFLYNIGSITLTILFFSNSSIETAIIEGILAIGSSVIFINGIILSIYLPVLLKNRIS